MIKSLQALKGYAFLLIFLSHCTFFSSRFGHLGAFGVCIFIILSGFLTGLRANYDTCNTKRGFDYKKTIKKIKQVYPLHIVTMLLMLVILVVQHKQIDYLILKIITNALMLHGFVPIEEFYFSLNSVSWYLSVYLLICVFAKPLLNVATRIIENRRLIGTLVFIAFFEVLWTFVCTKVGWGKWGSYINPIYRMFDFFVGILIGVSLKKNEIQSPSVLLGLLFQLVIIAIVAIIALQDLANSIWVSTFIWIPISLFEIYLFYSNSNKTNFWGKFFYNNKIVVFLGNIGVELFLFHKIIIHLWRSYIVSSSIMLRIAGIVSCLIVSILLSLGYHFLYNNLRRQEGKNNDNA